MDANGQLGELTANYLILHEFTADDFATEYVRTTIATHAATMAKDLRLMDELAAQVGYGIPAADLVAERLDDLLFRQADGT